MPTTTRNMKYKMAIAEPPSPIPPHARMPSYITAFQSSPVRICLHNIQKKNNKGLCFTYSNVLSCRKIATIHQSYLENCYKSSPKGVEVTARNFVIA